MEHLRVLKDMGADINYLNHRIMAAEDVYDIRVKSSNLSGIDVPKKISPTMIDDYPILAVAASMAKGKTCFKELMNSDSKKVIDLMVF